MQMSCPSTPQQNGVSERRHRTIREYGLSLMFHSGVSQSFWVEAFDTVTYLINRTHPVSLGNVSPFEKLYEKEFNFNNLKSFGCVCSPYI